MSRYALEKKIVVMMFLALSTMNYGFEETTKDASGWSWKGKLCIVGTAGLAIHMAYLYGKHIGKDEERTHRTRLQQEAARLRLENERLTQENNQLKSSVAQEQQRRFALEQRYGPSSTPPSQQVYQVPWWKRLFGLNREPQPPAYNADPSCSKSGSFWDRPR